MKLSIIKTLNAYKSHFQVFIHIKLNKMKNIKSLLLVTISLFTLGLQAQLNHNSIFYSLQHNDATLDSLMIRNTKFNSWNKSQKQLLGKTYLIKLDSTFSYVDSMNPSPNFGLNNKEEFLYDNYGRNTERIFYSLNYDTVGNGNMWYPNWKYSNHYNTSGYCDSITSFNDNYDIFTLLHTWKKNHLVTYFNDSLGRDTLDFYYEYNKQNNTWGMKQKHEYSYNDSGQYTFAAFYFWVGNSTWEGGAAKSWTYNNQYQVETTTRYGYYYNGNWIGSKKTVNVYDSLNRVERILYLYMDTATMQWDTNNFVSINTFDTAGNIEAQINYSINAQNNLDTVSFTKFLYNNDGYMLEEKKYIFAFNRWFAWSKDIYIYDSLNQVVSKREYGRVIDTSYWTKQFRYDTEYDYNYYNSQVSFPNLVIAVDNENIIHKSSLFIKDKDAWGLHSHAVDYYSGISASIENAQEIQNRIELYPNPANDVVYVRIDNMGQNINELFVFDVLGKEIKNIKLNNPLYKYDISELESGIYFISVRLENGEVFSKKFIKE